MAKRKHHRKKHRRVGAMSAGKKSMGMKLLTVAAGYLLADTINAQVDKINPIKKTDPVTNTKVPDESAAMIGELGIGGLLMLKSKNKYLGAAGGVLVGAGLKRALKKAGVIKGYQAVPVIAGNRRRVNGYQNTPVIAGSGVPPQLSGVPAQLQGFRVNGYNSQGSGVMGAVTAGKGSGIMAGSDFMN